MALIPLAFASAAASSGPLPYLRPYLVTFMVGQTILLAPGWLARLLTSETCVCRRNLLRALYPSPALHSRLAHYPVQTVALRIAHPGDWSRNYSSYSLNAVLRALVDCAGQALITESRVRT